MHIAIIGCGQLARMLAHAGWRLGSNFSFYAEEGENTSCVEGLGNIVHAADVVDVSGARPDAKKLFEALGQPDVVTVERESVDTELLTELRKCCAVHPCPEGVHIAQNRGREKSFANELGIKTAPFELINNDTELRSAIEKIGFPSLLKSCEDGYDGRGQWKLSGAEDVEAFLSSEGVKTELILEGFVSFEKEVSLISARSSNGECAFYPLTENVHRNGILLRSIAPAELADESLQATAERYAEHMLTKLDYVGVLSIEFFVVGNELVVNELAPRVHNSGHWTQAAGIASQFENHVRGISGQSLGSTKPLTVAGMVNLLGLRADTLDVSQGNVQLHDYNKSLRPNRKVGHVNAWSIDREQLDAQLDEYVQLLYPE